MTSPGAADEAAVLRALITGQPERQGILRQICQAATEALVASGAGISVMTEDGTRGACAASDPASKIVEDLQFVLGEGPCIDAFAERRPVFAPDLADPALHRWPVYAPDAYNAGVRAVFAFPLQVGAARLGVLDVFRDRAGPLSTPELRTALHFADVAVEFLLDQQDGHHAGAHDGLVSDVEQSAQLFQAQGMVMVQLGVSLQEALARMRAYAYAEDRRLDEIAYDIVNRTLRFDGDSH